MFTWSTAFTAFHVLLCLVQFCEFLLATKAGLLAGLDSTSAAQVVDILASLGHCGVNVMLSIHQPRPDVLRLMDSVLVLSPNGRLVYTGPTARLDAHLASLSIHPPPGAINVADYLLDYVISASPRRLTDMVTSYKQSDVCLNLRQSMEEMAVESATLSSGRMRSMQLPTGAKRQPFGVQLWMLSAVLFRRMYRHPFLIATGFVATLIAAVSLAFTFKDTGYDTQVCCLTLTLTVDNGIRLTVCPFPYQTCNHF